MNSPFERRVLLDELVAKRIRLTAQRRGLIEVTSSPTFERFKVEISKQADFKIQIALLEIGGNCRACLAAGDVALKKEDEKTATALSP